MKSQSHALPMSLSRLFTDEFGLPFKLILSYLIFTAFRPDQLLQGGKTLTYYPTIVILVLMVLWIRAPKKCLSNKQTKAYFWFVGLTILHLPFVRNYGMAWPIVKGTIFYGIPSYLYMIQFIDKYDKINLYLKLFAGLAIFIGILGLFGGGRVKIPSLSDENDFSLYMNILIPFAYFFAQETKNKVKKPFWYIALMIFVLANVASFSRGGFLGLLAVSLYIIKNSKRKITTIALALIVICFMVLFAPDKYWQEVETIFTQNIKESTAKERIESWKAGWHMFLDHPLIGVGPQNYPVYVPEYFQSYDGGSRRAEHMWGRVAHSLYITLLSEYGIVGTIIFFYILFCNIKTHKYLIRFSESKDQLIKDLPLNNNEKIELRQKLDFFHYASMAIMGGLIGYSSSGIFLSVLYYSYFMQLTACWVITVNIATQLECELVEMKNKSMEV